MTRKFISRSQDLRRNVEHGGALLQGYLSSLQLRDDTKLSLLLGVLAGLAVVAALAAYPGKPIDYSGVGKCVSAKSCRVIPCGMDSG